MPAHLESRSRRPLRRVALASTLGAVLAVGSAGVSLAGAGIAVAQSGPTPTASAALGGQEFKAFSPSTLAFDPAAETVTLPLRQGTTHAGTEKVWYVVTESSDPADASARGVSASPKLANALGTKAVQLATVIGGREDFAGTVDFSPVRKVVPGPPGNEFAGGTYVPGAIGDAAYSPLVTDGDGIVRDETQIANASGVHDSVVSIDVAKATVVLKTFFGFWNGHRTIYLHQDASSPVVAAAEGSTWAPNLDAAPGLGSNDPDTSARSAIIPIVNGATGVSTPDRQGLNSALRGEGDPMNINQEIPGQGNFRYSPVWDVHPAVWTQSAIDTGQRVLITSASQLTGLFEHGLVVPAGSGPANESLGGFNAAGFISNCPIIAQS